MQQMQKWQQMQQMQKWQQMMMMANQNNQSQSQSQTQSQSQNLSQSQTNNNKPTGGKCVIFRKSGEGQQGPPIMIQCLDTDRLSI